VNWDQPSSGIVNDSNPALTLTNDTGEGLNAASEGVAITAKSNADVAIVAETDQTLTGEFTSDNGIALFGYAPRAMGMIGANRAANAAVAGLNTTDPALPNVQQNPDGVGVLGVTNRFDAIGAAGIAFGPRSLGVLGQADSGLGVRGVGTVGGTEGVASGGPGASGFTTSDASPGVYGFGPGAKGSGVRGEGVAGPGVDAHSSAGPGVRALSDQAHGVFAEAKAENAAGVLGVNDDPGGFGVDGFSQSGTAVRGFTNSGTAMYAAAMTGRALDASNVSLDEPAISALNPAGTAVSAGSFGGSGVFAFGETGVLGVGIAGPDALDPAVGSGVTGMSFIAAGVCGTTLNGTGVLGIGHAKLGAWAGVFRGNVFVEGVLFKLASLFSIDHPLDPERKVLNHASVEAPEYKTFYDGVVTLDARGRARVRLPRWFEALNGEFRYQLTPLGSAAPDLHVAEEVKEGSFLIAGGAPRQKVCWQLTGVRRDAWATENPLVVEQTKRAARPRVASPQAADLEEQTDALKKHISELKKVGTERERAARARRRPTPAPTQAVPQPPAPAVKPRQIAEQMMATLKRLMRRTSAD
jgi:hypothetical protein